MDFAFAAIATKPYAHHVVHWNGKDTPRVELELECVTVGAIVSTGTRRS